MSARERQRVPAAALLKRGVGPEDSNTTKAIEATRSAGQPLDPATREFMEPRFGFDFSQVRIHADGHAAQAASAIGARAYTLGNDIAFDEGQYAPSSTAGRRLLAHELTHVVQQAGNAEAGSPRLSRDPHPGASTEDAGDQASTPGQGPQAASASSAEPDASDVTSMSITPEFAASLSHEQIAQRIAALDRAMARMQGDGGRLSPEFSTLHNNRRILLDALGDAGRTAQQTGLADRFGLPPLDERDQAKLRLAIGGTRAYEFLEQQQSMRRLAHHNESRGMGILNYTSQQVDAADRVERDLRVELANLGVATPEALVDLIDQQIPRMVLSRSKAVALGMLQENQKQAESELTRYGEGGSAADREGLMAADQELEQRQNAIRDIDVQLRAGQGQVRANESRGMGILNFSGQRAALTELRAIRESEFNQVRTAFGARFPVLLAEGYRPGRYARATPEDLARLTAEPLREILDNISEVREEIESDDMKVWHINRAVATAMAELGLSQQPVFAQAVQRHIERLDRDEAFLALVKAALAVVATVVSGPLAPFVGGVIGAYFVTEGVDRYSAESAAENVALDPEARDISMNEPELGWLIVDIVGAVIDAGAVLRALRPVARAAVQSGRIAEFATAARRVLSQAPEVADRLVASLRRRLGRGAEGAAEAAGDAAHGISGAGRSLDDYVDALRAEPHGPGSVGGRWDHASHPAGRPVGRWEPGMPIDMPNERGAYPAYDLGRSRYWRNRAHFELQGRQAGSARRVPGNTVDPVKGLSDEQLQEMAQTGRAPQYAYPNRAGQTWELEHVGVPQRVGKALEDLGLSRSEAARLTRASDPGNLLEVTPLEHAFFDAEAHSFGRLRGDASGAMWPGTQAADVRLQRPLYYMTDAEIGEIVTRSQGMNFGATPRTVELRAQLAQEISARSLGMTPP
jgi:hypothetical protein